MGAFARPNDSASGAQTVSTVPHTKLAVYFFRAAFALLRVMETTPNIGNLKGTNRNKLHVQFFYPQGYRITRNTVKRPIIKNAVYIYITLEGKKMATERTKILFTRK